MAQFLSDSWLDEMEEAAKAFVPSEPADLSLREVITNSPAGTVSYALRVSGSGLALDRDTAEADVTFTQTYATAAALHKGELTTKEAFFAGLVKVSGQPNALLTHAEVLQSVGAVFEDVRARTTF